MIGEFRGAREAIHAGRGICGDFGWVTEEAAAGQVAACVEDSSRVTCGRRSGSSGAVARP